MKKIVAFALCLILIFALAVPAFAVGVTERIEDVDNVLDWQINETGTGTVTHNGVNLRSGPGTSYSSGGLVYLGDRFTYNFIEVLSSGEKWYHVTMTSGQCVNLSGYLRLDMVSAQRN